MSRSRVLRVTTYIGIWVTHSLIQVGSWAEGLQYATRGDYALASFIGRCYGHRFVSPAQGSHIRTGSCGFVRFHWLLVRMWLFSASPPGGLRIDWRFLATQKWHTRAASQPRREARNRKKSSQQHKRVTPPGTGTVSF